MKIAEYGDLEIYEWVNGFEIRHVPSGTEHWIGDGVDWLSIETDDGEIIILSPGTEEFNQAAQNLLESAHDELIEAYFGGRR